MAYFTDGVDQYVLDSMPEFKGKKLVCADRADIELDDVESEGEPLAEEQVEKLSGFMATTLGDRVEGRGWKTPREFSCGGIGSC